MIEHASGHTSVGGRKGDLGDGCARFNNYHGRHGIDDDVCCRVGQVCAGLGDSQTFGANDAFRGVIVRNEIKGLSRYF